MSDQHSPPIIVIKKKVSHGGHHGGAWKVAYADFVTAMMALFIVLWLLNTSDQVKQAIAAYFNDPSGTGKQLGSASTGSGESLSVNKDDMNQLKEKLEQALKQSPHFDQIKNYVNMSVTGEGLRVEMLESEHGMFFESGSPLPTEQGRELIVKLAQELGQLPNDLLIEGHTDARPFGGKADYTNWELSSDRANAARRLMEANGLRPGQVVQVRGFADHSLRDPNDPDAASNRRVSVIVRYKNLPPSESPAEAAPASEEHKAGSAPPEHH
jgi:chemotaxis protein MotB